MHAHFLKVLLCGGFLLLLIHCSRKSSDPRSGVDDNGGMSDGSETTFCGYKFDPESPAVMAAQLSKLDGSWIEWTQNSCTRATDIQGNEYCYKFGFQFNALQNLFGEVTFKYKSVMDVQSKRVIEITPPPYNKISISKLLSGNYAGYRLAQLEGSQGYARCQSFAFRYDENERRLYYTRPSSLTGSVRGEPVPTLDDFIKEYPSPETAYWVKF